MSPSSFEPPTDNPHRQPSPTSQARRGGFLRKALEEMRQEDRGGQISQEPLLGEENASPLPPKLLVRLAQERLAQRRRRLFLLRLGVVLLAVLVSGVLAAGVALWQQTANASHAFMPSQLASPMLPPEQVLLVMGVDVNPQGKTPAEAFEGVRTDTIMMMRIHTKGGPPRLSIVSLPRDTKVTLASGRTDKLNSAFTIGGMDGVKRVVEQSFGIPIDHAVVVNLHGVRDVVDAVGGLDVYVPQKMSYHDFSGKLHIEFDPGWHHMSGEEAVGFLRFRHDALGDIGRIKRQQQFLSAVTRKMKDPLVLARVPALVNVVMANLQTDMGLNDLIQLAWLGKSLSRESIRLATLPGEPRNEWASFWVVNPTAAQTLLTRMILGRSTQSDTEVTSLDVGVLYPADVADRLPALKAALAERQLNVVCATSRKRETTQIVEHTGRVSDAWVQRLRSVDARLNEAHWVVAPYGASYEPLSCSGHEDMTLILGHDATL
ncbi:MAG: LCP family protein [Vampirovibrionales bacterium]